MPEQRPAMDAPGRAVEATIERIRDSLLTNCDPETLNEIRAAFRRKIPFRLRSYAAALLILEASSSPARESAKGDGRRKDQKQRQKKDKGEQKREGSSVARVQEPRQPDAQRVQKTSRQEEEDRPRYEGQGTTVFFGMGKRQRLYPRVLLRILLENGGLAPEEIGEIRSFDNYSFADIDPLKAEALIAALSGFAFRGRVLTVGKARKRGENAPEDNTGKIEGVEAGSQEYEGDEEFDDAAEIGDDFTDRDEGAPEGFEDESDGGGTGEEPRS